MPLTGQIFEWSPSTYMYLSATKYQLPSSISFGHKKGVPKQSGAADPQMPLSR